MLLPSQTLRPSSSEWSSHTGQRFSWVSGLSQHPLPNTRRRTELGTSCTSDVSSAVEPQALSKGHCHFSHVTQAPQSHRHPNNRIAPTRTDARKAGSALLKFNQKQWTPAWKTDPKRLRSYPKDQIRATPQAWSVKPSLSSSTGGSLASRENRQSAHAQKHTRPGHLRISQTFLLFPSPEAAHLGLKTFLPRNGSGRILTNGKAAKNSTPLYKTTWLLPAGRSLSFPDQADTTPALSNGALRCFRW